MSLLDTFFKLQVLKQQQEQAQVNQIHSLLYLANIAQKMNETKRTEDYRTAMSGVSPNIEISKPTEGMSGLDYGYDVANPETMQTELAAKPIPQYMRELGTVATKYEPKEALPYFKEADLLEKPTIHAPGKGGLYSTTRQNVTTELVPPAATEEKRPYKKGQILPSQEEGDQLVNYQVTGYDENNMPILKKISGGPRNKPGSGDKPPKLTMADVKGGFSMAMTSIKNKIALDLINSPAEAQALAGQPAENLMSMMLSGNLKSIPAEKKQAYMAEIKEVEDYYGSLGDQVLGKKGATPKPAKAAAAPAPAGKTLNTLPPWSKYIGTSGGKEVWSPDGGKTRYIKE